MSYIENRIVHDADSHVMEPSNWLDDFADATLRNDLAAILGRDFPDQRNREVETAVALQRDPTHRANDAQELMARKNYQAIGAFMATDRPRVLDLMGVSSQLVFPTYYNVLLEQLEQHDEVDLLYRVAAASNRALREFCSIDDRLLAVANVPLADFELSSACANQAIRAGASALLIPWACPQHHATSHIGLDPLWAQAQESGTPILFHVGAADRVLPPQHANNGLERVADFHGGDENFRSISYMAIGAGPMQALSMLILDGVLDRFPGLKFGVIELGAIWLPGFMRQLDCAYEAFARHETRLQKLKLKPSEYVTRQIRVTPYPTEPAGWIIEQAGTHVCMFSSDYPHVEGGRNPYGRFEKSTENLDEPAKDRFYRANFEDLMGPRLCV